MSIGSFLRKIRLQTAIYWKTNGSDGYGNKLYDSPVEIDCRWEDVDEVMHDENGEMYVAKSMVIVDREMARGDWLMKGELDSTIPDSPIGETTAYEIRKFMAIPDIKNKAVLYEVIL